MTSAGFSKVDEISPLDRKNILIIQTDPSQEKENPLSMEMQNQSKEQLSFLAKSWKEIKSTLSLEDWVASYLGVLGSLLIIIIYVCNPAMGEISMKKWDKNPFDTFKTGSNGTYWIIFIVIFCMGAIWVRFLFQIHKKFLKYRFHLCF